MKAWPDAPRPDAASVAARRDVLVAATRGDHATVLAAASHPAPRVRATALQALADLGQLDDDVIHRANADPDAGVRRSLARVGSTTGAVPLGPLLADDDPAVAEMAAWAAGERTDTAPLVPQLCELATDHDDPLCREAAIAALGAIGDPRGVPAILAGTADKPAVRRRAVLALAPFLGDGPEVDEALQRALTDRDWQVRQAAEDLS